MRVSGKHVSMDALRSLQGEDNSLVDVLENRDSPRADGSLMNESLRREIDRSLSTLTERERRSDQIVLRHRHAARPTTRRDRRQVRPHASGYDKSKKPFDGCAAISRVAGC